jgi:hypothetical protein
VRPVRAHVRVLVSLLAVVAALALRQTSAMAAFVGSGTHPWAIVLCNFSNQNLSVGTKDPAPASYFNQMYGDAGAGSGKYNFEDWWHDASFGQLSAAGTAVVNGSHADSNGWHTAAETRDAWSAKGRFDKIVDCENAALPDVNYNNYYGVVAIFPEVGGQTTGGISSGATAVTINDSSSSTSNVTTTNYWPVPPFLMNIDDGSGNNNETVNVTAANDNGDGTETFTITRGANGTSAKAHNAGAGAGVPGDFGEVGGGPGQSSVLLSDGHTYSLAQVILPNETNLTGAQHETGHGFGYSHSRKLSYSTTDYQDSTDVMSAYTGTYEYTALGTSFGGSVLGSAVDDKGPGLDAIDLDLQGWIPSGRHFLFNNSSPPNQSTITLHALSDPNAIGDNSDYLEARSPASVSIENASATDSNGNPLTPTNPTTCSPAPYSCTTSQYYTLEYRQKIGWDSGFPASAVVLHLFGNDNRSYWVDQLPNGHSGLLYAGDEYVDATNHTYVAVNSIGGASAHVTLGSAKITPTLTYSGDTSGEFNDQVTLAGDLTVGGAPVPGASVTLSIGTQSCPPASTDAAGHVSCQVTLTQDPGSSYTANASYGGDGAYNGATSSPATFTINKEESQVTYTGPQTVHYHDPVTVSATLTDPESGLPIAGKTLTFTLGPDSCTSSFPTDGSGNASCVLTPTQTSATSIVASFAGDTDYLGSIGAHPFATTPEETTMTYTGPTVILAGASSATLTATMVEDGANDHDGDGGSPAPLPAQTVTLSIGSQSCTGTTDGSGHVSCTIPSITVPLGPETVTASFAGNNYYQPSSDSKSVIVFAFPSRGAFILGDTTAATATGSSTVTWWGDTWWQLNALSGRPAPAAFKGFASTITLPTTTPPLSCGSDWSTSGGNSPPPVSGVPSYMGVVVSSLITKDGRSISGDSVHIVVVKVDPGYAPDPSNHGTGTIVATFC